VLILRAKEGDSHLIELFTDREKIDRYLRAHTSIEEIEVIEREINPGSTPPVVMEKDALDMLVQMCSPDEDEGEPELTDAERDFLKFFKEDFLMRPTFS